MMLVDSDNLDLDIHSQDRFHCRDTLPYMALVDFDNLQFRKLFHLNSCGGDITCATRVRLLGLRDLVIMSFNQILFTIN